MLFELYSEKHNSKIIKTGVRQPLALRDKSVRQLQGDVCIQRRYSADLGCNQQLFDFLLPFDALFELHCIHALSWWHAIGWLAFCIQKQLDTRQDEDEWFATTSNALQPRWGKDLSFFPKRWLEFYDQMTKITAPLSEICERILSPTHKQHKCVNSYTKQLCHRHVRLHCMWNIPQRPPRILYSTSDKSVDS